VEKSEAQKLRQKIHEIQTNTGKSRSAGFSLNHGHPWQSTGNARSILGSRIEFARTPRSPDPGHGATFTLELPLPGAEERK